MRARAALMVASAFLASASPSLAFFESGESLLAKLKACDRLEGGEFAAKEMFQCARGMGYVSALYDAAVTPACSPDGITQGQVVTAVRRALEARPERSGGAASDVALDAIHAAYLCAR